MFTTIRQRFVFFFLGLTIVPTLLVGGVVSAQSFAIQQQQALALQEEVARRVADQVIQFIAGLEDELNAVGQVGDFAEQDLSERATLLSQLLSYQDGFQQLTLLDERGFERISLNRVRLVPRDELVSRSASPEFQHLSTSGATYFSPLLFDEFTGEPLIRIAVPLIEARTGGVYAVLVGDARIKIIWDALRALELNEGEQVYLIEAQGQVIAHRQPSVVLRGTHFERPDQDGIYPGLSGEQVVLSSVPVQLGNHVYYVIAEQWVSKALALAFNTVFITVVVMTIAVFTAGVLGILAARPVVLPIETLAKAAQAIESGNLSVRIENQSNDEIGVLSKAFNSMTLRLGQTLEGLEQQVVALREAERYVQQLNADLERRVHERTAELWAANKRLTELDRLKSKFIADLSHELRTPIAVLSTRVYLLERGRPERHGDYLQGLKEQIEVLTRFVNSVFDLSRLDLRRDKIEFEPVNINSVVEQVVNILSPQAGAAGLRLSLQRASEPAISRGEPNQLSQMVTHLVTNAIQYTQSGRIDVCVQVDDVQHCVRIQVKDSGIGISTEDIRHLFERFYRGSNVGQSTLHGIGLGLSIVQEIVVLHQGEILVESELGSGSTFTVQLPLEHGSFSPEGLVEDGQKLPD